MEVLTQNYFFVIPLAAALMLFVFVLKAYALWLAARRGSRGWFIALFLIQTLGILEIIYIFFVVKPDAPAKNTNSQVTPNIEPTP